MKKIKNFLWFIKEVIIVLFLIIPMFLFNFIYEAAHFFKKKITLSLLILILSLNVNAQPFAGIEAGTKGAGVNIGYLGNGLEIKAGTNMSLYRATTPALFYASLGYQIKLTNNEEDNWSVLPSAGYTYSSYEDFTAYNNGGEIIKITEFKPKYSLELGKDKHIGRIYINANYAGYTFYNIGIRAYIK